MDHSPTESIRKTHFVNRCTVYTKSRVSFGNGITLDLNVAVIIKTRVNANTLAVDLFAVEPTILSLEKIYCNSDGYFSQRLYITNWRWAFIGFYTYEKFGQCEKL